MGGCGGRRRTYQGGGRGGGGARGFDNAAASGPPHTAQTGRRCSHHPHSNTPPPHRPAQTPPGPARAVPAARHLLLLPPLPPALRRRGREHAAVAGACRAAHARRPAGAGLAGQAWGLDAAAPRCQARRPRPLQLLGAPRRRRRAPTNQPRPRPHRGRSTPRPRCALARAAGGSRAARPGCVGACPCTWSEAMPGAPAALGLLAAAAHSCRRPRSGPRHTPNRNWMLPCARLPARFAAARRRTALPLKTPLTSHHAGCQPGPCPRRADPPSLTLAHPFGTAPFPFGGRPASNCLQNARAALHARMPLPHASAGGRGPAPPPPRLCSRPRSNQAFGGEATGGEPTPRGVDSAAQGQPRVAMGACGWRPRARGPRAGLPRGRQRAQGWRRCAVPPPPRRG
jgi:hypothetical protein